MERTRILDFFRLNPGRLTDRNVTIFFSSWISFHVYNRGRRSLPMIKKNFVPRGYSFLKYLTVSTLYDLPPFLISKSLVRNLGFPFTARRSM